MFTLASARCYIASVRTEEYVAKRLSFVRKEDCLHPQRHRRD